MTIPRGPVLALTANLMDAVAITDAARRLEIRVVVASPENALEVLRRDPPSLVLVDLTSEDAIELLERGALRSFPAIGFYPHVDRALGARAIAAGISRAMPRSAFFARLPDLLAEAAPPRLPDPGAGC